MVQSTLDNLNKLIEIKTTKDQVKYLYDNYPETIKDDRTLWFKFLEIFHSITPNKNYRFVVDYIQVNKLNNESVTRAGRKFRELEPKKYKRDEKITRTYEKAFRDSYSPLNNG